MFRADTADGQLVCYREVMFCLPLYSPGGTLPSLKDSGTTAYPAGGLQPLELEFSGEITGPITGHQMASAHPSAP
jgi:hypothetical protein